MAHRHAHARARTPRRATVAATFLAAGAAITAIADSACGQLTGELSAHDPSSIMKDGTGYYYFATGPGIVSRSSTNKTAWTAGQSVFGAPPAWTQQAVPSFGGTFWAPDVAYFNGKYHVYYSVSSWGSIDSAIGLVTSPSLANPTWTDHGKVVQSDAAWEAGPNTDTTAFNAIDPSILTDTNGKVWMSFGSYSSGILVTELNPSTGKRLNTSTLDATLVANNTPGGGWGSSIEGSALTQRGSYYYLFVNYGGCCSGVNSTYDIRVGRSTSPTGPFVDRNGIDMRSGGGSIFLDDDGKMIGPGHFARMTEGADDYFSYHYYNGDVNGAPTFGLRKLYWTSDAWPSYAAVNPDWTGTASNGWSTSSNWSGGTVPNGTGHVANFGSNSAAATSSGLTALGGRWVSSTSRATRATRSETPATC
jgi:arabinan endo-1,5-alpha-L-arabinosidase